MNNSDMPAMPLGDACVHQSNVNFPLSGLTKREAFVMAAMQGLCAYPGATNVEKMVRNAVFIADATLAELEK